MAAITKGIYSLYDGWIKVPQPTEMGEYDKEEFNKQFSEWEERYNEIIND